jgi:hypothetical protein
MGVMLTTNPDEVAAWKNDRFGNVCDGTSQNQWSNVAKPRASAEMTGPRRRVARHDLRVLLSRGRPALLGRERADVIGHEPVHGRPLGLIGRRVVRGDDVRGHHPAVGGRVDQPEQLGVDVLVLLAGIGRRGVHVGRDPVRDRPGRPGDRVHGPVRDRIGQVQAGDALEGRDFARLVQAAEQVVERAVLEHDHDDVIEGVARVGARHDKNIRAGHSQL